GASGPVKVTVTSVLFQPLAFASGNWAAEAVGAVLSMLIPVLETGALTLPALSVQVPGPAVWAAPSALSVTGAVQKSIVDRASVPVKVTVTSVLFQPLAFASGNWAAEAVGAVLSMLIPVLETGSLTLPALSVQVPGPDVWAAPSALSVTGEVPKSIVDR